MTQQQPILTYNEVVCLLETELPMSQEERKLFRRKVRQDIYLIRFSKYASEDTIPLLEKCANFLRSKGIYVYFEEDPSGVYYFVVGETGRLYEQLQKYSDYLTKLRRFWYEYEDLLPIDKPPDLPDKLYHYTVKASLICFDLFQAFVKSKKRLIRQCEKAQKLINEIDSYLDSIKEVRRSYEALSQPVSENEAIHYLNDLETMRLLEGELLADDEEALTTFKRMTGKGYLSLIDITDPDKEIPILERCVEFLRSKGLYVYYKTFPSSLLYGKPKDADLVVGRRGELVAKIKEYYGDLEKIYFFIKEHKNLLPPEVVDEQKRVKRYLDKLSEIEGDTKISLARCENKAAIKYWCEEVEKFLRETDNYLESIRYLRRMQALTTL